MIEKTLTHTRNAEGICATRGVELIGGARYGRASVSDWAFHGY
jgi:hypothetical protein